MKKLLVGLLVLGSISAFANDKFECDRATVRKHAIQAAEHITGIKTNGSIKVGMNPGESKTSFETWFARVKTDEFELALIIPLDKKVDEEGKVVCGWF